MSPLANVLLICLILALCGIAAYEKIRDKPLLTILSHEVFTAFSGFILLGVVEGTFQQASGAVGCHRPGCHLPLDSFPSLPAPAALDLPAFPEGLRCQRFDLRIDCDLRFRGSGDDAAVVLYIDATQLRLVDADGTRYPPRVLMTGSDSLSRIDTHQQIAGPNPVTLRASFDGVPLTSDVGLTLRLKMWSSDGDTLLVLPAGTELN